MSGRRLAVAVLCVLVTKAAVGAFAFGLVLSHSLEGSSPAFRPEGTEHHGVAMAGYVAWSLAFVLLFERGSRGRGWLDGMRFGLLAWLLYFLPMTLGIYGYFAVGGEWAALALLTGLAEALACGVVAARVLRGAALSPARAVTS